MADELLSDYVASTAILPPSDIPDGSALGWINISGFVDWLNETYAGARSEETLYALFSERFSAGTAAADIVNSYYYYIVDYDIYGTATVALSPVGSISVDYPTVYALSLIHI